jgi:hypothetical protein
MTSCFQTGLGQVDAVHSRLYTRSMPWRLPRKGLDLLADDGDASFVRRVELEHALAEEIGSGGVRRREQR